MNKNLLPIIGVVVLLGLGYFFFGKRTTNQPFSPTGPRTLASLLGLDSQMCTYEDTEAGDKGTYYVAKGRMRGDATTTEDGQTRLSHMIYKDGTMYIWMDGEKTGYKMTTNFEEKTDVETKETDTQTPASAAFDTDKEIDYRCNAWRADNSIFELPEGVNFMDFSQYAMPAVPATENGSSGVDTSSQCAACESLDGDTKAQCLTAFGCN